MENIIDAFLGKIFNHPEVLWLNFIFGILIISYGIFYITKKEKEKKKSLLYLVIGSLTLISSTTQMLLPLF